MAKKAQTIANYEPTIKKTSSSGKMSMLKTSSMNKHKKRSFKAYRGQGR